MSLGKKAKNKAKTVKGKTKKDAGKAKHKGKKAKSAAKARLAGVAGVEEGGEATCHRSNHKDGPSLKGDIHYPAASGQGVRDCR